MAFARPASAAHAGVSLQLQQQPRLAGYVRGPWPWSRQLPRPAFPPRTPLSAPAVRLAAAQSAAHAALHHIRQAAFPPQLRAHLPAACTQPTPTSRPHDAQHRVSSNNNSLSTLKGLRDTNPFARLADVFLGTVEKVASRSAASDSWKQVVVVGSKAGGSEVVCGV